MSELLPVVDVQTAIDATTAPLTDVTETTTTIADPATVEAVNQQVAPAPTEAVPSTPPRLPWPTHPRRRRHDRAVADTTAPVADATPPVADTTAPLARATAPVADTTAPVPDATAAVTATTAPAADATAPVADATAPVADATAPVADAAAVI